MKRSVIFRKNNGIYELTHDLLNNLILWEIGKLGFDKNECYFLKNNYFRSRELGFLKFRGIAKSILTIVLKIFKKNDFCVLAGSKQ